MKPLTEIESLSPSHFLSSSNFQTFKKNRYFLLLAAIEKFQKSKCIKISLLDNTILSRRKKEYILNFEKVFSNSIHRKQQTSLSKKKKNKRQQKSVHKQTRKRFTAEALENR